MEHDNDTARSFRNRYDAAAKGCAAALPDFSRLSEEGRVALVEIVTDFQNANSSMIHDLMVQGRFSGHWALLSQVFPHVLGDKTLVMQLLQECNLDSPPACLSPESTMALAWDAALTSVVAFARKNEFPEVLAWFLWFSINTSPVNTRQLIKEFLQIKKAQIVIPQIMISQRQTQSRSLW